MSNWYLGIIYITVNYKLLNLQKHEIVIYLYAKQNPYKYNSDIILLFRSNYFDVCCILFKIKNNPYFFAL